MQRDRIMQHGEEGALESRVHLCPGPMGRFPHHVELHLYSGGEFMGMMGYSAEDARRLAELLLAAAEDLDTAAVPG